MEKSIEFEKKLKKGKGHLIAAIVFLILTIGLVFIMYSSYKEDMENVSKLIDVSEEGKYASVDVHVMTDYFATTDYSGIEHKTYFVFDERYMYIVDIDSESRELLNDIYDYSYNSEEGDEAPEAVVLKGMTKEIPDDLKEIAIDSYNEMFETDFLNESNFSTYFGVVYLDTYEDPMTDLPYALIISLPFAIFGIVFLISYITMRSNTKKNKAKYGDNWDRIINEINATDTIYYKNARLYLTENYLISYQNGLEIFDYKEIVWVYPHEYRYNGVVTQKSIYVVTKDSKAHKLATLSTSKKNRVLFDELYNTLINKMPDILKGYTKENIKAAKELYQK